MSAYFDALATGASNVFSWPGILIPVAGTLMAMTTSFLPGIGGASLAVLALVLTATWDPVSVMLLFGALTGGATFMGSVTAILFNIPGNASSAATLLDGYPLGQNGQTRTAIACAATASAVGSVFGVLVMIMALPFIREVLLEFGPLERLLLGLWGLSTIIAIPKGSLLKAAAMTALGLVFALIGSNPNTGAARWTFGSLELYSGIGQIPILVGIFTVAELIGWTGKYDLKARAEIPAAQQDSMWIGIRSVFRNKALTLRSSILGTFVGIIPGVGGTVAGFVAYGQAVQMSKGDTENFGKGDIRGLIAPEAAMDAKDGGSLIPAIAFGLPGSEMGILLVAMFGIHGMVPGRTMLNEQLPLTFTLVIALLFSNILTSVLGLAASPALARLSSFKINRIALPLFIISVLTIVQLHGQVSDLFIVVIIGVIASFLNRYKWPRIPFIIAFILGGFIENNLNLAQQLVGMGRIVPYERPGALIIGGMLLFSIYWMTRKQKRRSQSKVQDETSLTLSVFLTVIAFIFFTTSFIGGTAYSYLTKTVSLIAVAALLGNLYVEISIRREQQGSILRAFSGLAGSSKFTGFQFQPIMAIAALPVVVLFIGMMPALAVFAFTWLSASRPPTLVNGLRATIWAGVTYAVSYFFLIEFSHTILPKGYLVSYLF